MLFVISNALKLSLTNSFPVAQEKQMIVHFYNNRQKVKFGQSCPLNNHYLIPAFNLHNFLIVHYSTLKNISQIYLIDLGGVHN